MLLADWIDVQSRFRPVREVRFAATDVATFAERGLGRRRCSVSAVTLVDLRNGFRDEHQRRRAQAIIHDRLADDRNQQECRYLMRLWWQLEMTYQEVTHEDLRTHVTAPKLQAVEDLIRAVRTSPDEIDAWIAAAEQAHPVVHDRGHQAESD